MTYSSQHGYRPNNPCRNLCADILLQAMVDVQTPETLRDLPERTKVYSKDLLALHQRAMYYFKHNNHAFLCHSLDLDPEIVKERAFTGEVSGHEQYEDRTDREDSPKEESSL